MTDRILSEEALANFEEQAKSRVTTGWVQCPETVFDLIIASHRLLAERNKELKVRLELYVADRTMLRLQVQGLTAENKELVALIPKRLIQREGELMENPTKEMPHG